MTRARWHLYANLVVLVWLLAAATAAFAHRGIPEPRWLMIHLLLLGAVTNAIVIWSAHFATTLLRQPDPPSRRAEGTRLLLVNLGIIAVLTGVLAEHTVVVTAGALAIGAAVIAHLASIVRAGRRALSGRFAFMTRYYLAAGVLLIPGITAGVVLSRGSGGTGLWVTHQVLNIFGWIGLTVLGTLVTLWPTMLRTQIVPGAERDARRALRLLTAGVVVAAAAALVSVWAVAALGLLAYLAGIAVLTRQWWREAQRKHPGSFATWSALAAVTWLGVTIATLAVRWVAAGWSGSDASAASAMQDAATPLAVGFAAQVLAGALTALIPAVLGGGPATTRRTIAVVERFGAARVVVTNGGLLLCLLPVPSLVRVVCSIAVLGSLVLTLPLLVRAAVVARRGPVADEPESPRSAWGSAAAGSALLVLAVVLGVAADPTAAGLGARPAAGASVVPTGETTTVQVQAVGMRFVPDRIEVPYGNRLVIEVTNADDLTHDLVLDTGADSGRLAPGQSASVDVGVVGRTLDGWCSVAGHRQMGMVMTVTVTGGPSAADAPDEHTMAGHGMSDGSGVASDVTVDPMADPGPGFRAWDASLPSAPPGRTHRVTLTVQELVRDVAPGVQQRSWTFGGSVPGPILRGRVGDRFVVTLVNDGSIGHSVDFHAGSLAPDRPMRTIDPGEQLTYRFTATRSGIWMYHCSTMPMSLHIANGMFGAVIIDPPRLPDVDREYLIIQSELYLGADGEISDEAKVAAQQPDAVVFNGYVSQYDHRPLTARVGERVRFWVLDAGPNRPSSFHVVGGQFDTVYNEGSYTLQSGGAGSAGAQVLPLLPAQGGFVELEFRQPGNYPFVTHIMSDAESGAHGIVHVTR